MTESTPDIKHDQSEPERPNPSPAGDRTPPAAEGDTAPTETVPADGSPRTGQIGDDQLPEDLRPTDDNPLAQPDESDDADGGVSLGPDGPRG